MKSFGTYNEETPPGMEKWVLKRKPEFKKRYGDDWEERLYATAWAFYKKHGAPKDNK